VIHSTRLAADTVGIRSLEREFLTDEQKAAARNPCLTNTAKAAKASGHTKPGERRYGLLGPESCPDRDEVVRCSFREFVLATAFAGRA
jgi:hypothetical protein